METIADTEVERAFEVGTSSEVSVHNVAGRITIRAADVSSVTVRARKRGTQHAVENTEIEMDQIGQRVTVRTRQLNHQNGWLRSVVTNSMSAVEYDVTVPRECKVEAKGVSCGIELMGTRLGATLNTVSGHIMVEDVSGGCALQSVSGAIDAARIEGRLEAHSTSGSLDIRDARLPEFHCHSVSGRMAIETPLATGAAYHIHTVSGSIRVQIPADSGVTVQMKSVSGSVTCDLPAQIVKSGRRSWQGVINGGGATLDMHSVSGSLRIGVSSSSVAGFSAARPRETEQDRAAREEARVDILKKLQQGELTVEEAMGRLDETSEGDVR